MGGERERVRDTAIANDINIDTDRKTEKLSAQLKPSPFPHIARDRQPDQPPNLPRSALLEKRAPSTRHTPSLALQIHSPSLSTTILPRLFPHQTTHLQAPPALDTHPPASVSDPPTTHSNLSHPTRLWLSPDHDADGALRGSSPAMTAVATEVPLIATTAASSSH
eukprot:2886987-Rhodomonas_salina.1